jgi:phospholipid/cholesterol/gamma-HCH transport system substrate-binding protein
VQNSLVETLIGAAVIVVAVAFLAFAYTSTGTAGAGGYDVTAAFNKVDGVNVGTDVRMSGIKIGTVARMDLDPQTYNAVLHLSVRDDVKLPDDSSVRITSEGILGGQYLSIEPGGSPTMIAAGGEIENTQGAIDLIGLLGRTIFQSGTGEAGANTNPGGTTP